MEHRSARAEEIERLIAAITAAAPPAHDDRPAWQPLHFPPGGREREADPPADDRAHKRAAGRILLVLCGMAIVAVVLAIAVPHFRESIGGGRRPARPVAPSPPIRARPSAADEPLPRPAAGRPAEAPRRQEQAPSPPDANRPHGPGPSVVIRKASTDKASTDSGSPSTQRDAKRRDLPATRFSRSPVARRRAAEDVAARSSHQAGASRSHDRTASPHRASSSQTGRHRAEPVAAAASTRHSAKPDRHRSAKSSRSDDASRRSAKRTRAHPADRRVRPERSRKKPASARRPSVHRQTGRIEPAPAAARSRHGKTRDRPGSSPTPHLTGAALTKALKEDAKITRRLNDKERVRIKADRQDRR